jgi:hypothetical protein
MPGSIYTPPPPTKNPGGPKSKAPNDAYKSDDRVSGLFDGPGWDSSGGKKDGRGYYNLPDAVGGWSGPSRYAIPGVSDYITNVQPIRDYFAGELSKDYRGTLAEQGRKSVDRSLNSAKRSSSEAATRAGYAGGMVSSPLVGEQLAIEDQARAGGYGLAAQQATMFAQQMKSAAATGLQNTEANILNSWLVPAQMQASNSARVPISGGGPSTWATAAQAAAAVGSFFSG